MTWQENIEDFGQEIELDTTFRFECHPGLRCFGICCGTEITLTPYDIARMRGRLSVDSGAFLATYCKTYVEPRTGFPFVVLKHKENGRCVFLGRDGCGLYESRPSCCRNYPLARVIDEDDKTGKKVIRYYLQQGAAYCEGVGRGPAWTVGAYCEANGLGPYEKANDLFLDIPFAFNNLPYAARQDSEVRSMIFQALFNFDRFFEKYGRFPRAAIPNDDGELIAVIRRVTLSLMEKIAELNSTK